jgi:hypothetical protein
VRRRTSAAGHVDYKGRLLPRGSSRSAVRLRSCCVGDGSREPGSIREWICPAFAPSSRCTPCGCVEFPCAFPDNSRVTKAVSRPAIGRDAQQRGSSLQEQHCHHTDATTFTCSGHRSWQRAVAWHARQSARNGATCEHYCAAISRLRYTNTRPRCSRLSMLATCTHLGRVASFTALASAC